MAGGFSSHAADDDGPTISPLVLSTMANNSLCSAFRHIEFRHRIVEVFAEGGPLTLGDLKVFMRFAHGTAGIVLRATCGPTDHLGHVVFEAGRADAVMRFVNGSVRIQDWIVHNPINEVVNYGSNRIDATESLVERRLAG